MNDKSNPRRLARSLRQADSFVAYYGSGGLDILAGYPLVILDGDKYREEEIRQIRDGPTIVLAYLSVGEDPARQLAADWYALDKGGQPIRNERWATYVVNVASGSWRQHLLLEMAKRQSQGFAGLFLDTVDTTTLVDPSQQATKALIHLLRQSWPDGIFLMNRGFDVLHKVVKDIDGVVFEAFTCRHEADGFKPWGGADLLWTETVAAHLRESKLPVFALDYAPAGSILEEKCLQRARRWGFVPYVTESVRFLPCAMS